MRCLAKRVGRSLHEQRLALSNEANRSQQPILGQCPKSLHELLLEMVWTSQLGLKGFIEVPLGKSWINETILSVSALNLVNFHLRSIDLKQIDSSVWKALYLRNTTSNVSSKMWARDFLNGLYPRISVAFACKIWCYALLRQHLIIDCLILLLSYTSMVLVCFHKC